MDQSASKRCPKETSKYHRDQLKVGIDALRDELDASVGVHYCPKSKMGQLHVLHLATAFLQKDEYFQTCVPNQSDAVSSVQRELVQKALFGFLIMVDSESESIFYLSENVYDYLGFGMADLCSHNKLADIILDSDRPLSDKLLRQSLGSEQNAVLRMLVGGPAKKKAKGMACHSDYEVFHVRGQHCRYFSGPHIKTVFVGVCMPLPSPRHTSTPKKRGAADFSVTLDLHMRIIDASHNCQHLVGSDLAFGSSWYQLLHPSSLKDAQMAHRDMLGQGRARGHAVVLGYGWAPAWCYCVLQASRLKEQDVIVITNRVIQHNEVEEFKRFCTETRPNESNIHSSRKRRHESNPQVPTVKVPRPASTHSAPELTSEMVDFVLDWPSQKADSCASCDSPSTISDEWSPAPESAAKWEETLADLIEWTLYGSS